MPLRYSGLLSLSSWPHLRLSLRLCLQLGSGSQRFCRMELHSRALCFPGTSFSSKSGTVGSRCGIQVWAGSGGDSYSAPGIFPIKLGLWMNRMSVLVVCQAQPPSSGARTVITLTPAPPQGFSWQASPRLLCAGDGVAAGWGAGCQESLVSPAGAPGREAGPLVPEALSFAHLLLDSFPKPFPLVMV